MGKYKQCLKYLLVVSLVGLIFYIYHETHFDGRWWAEKKYDEYIKEHYGSQKSSPDEITNYKKTNDWEPSIQEIYNLKQKLPIEVKDGLFWTNVVYDKDNKIQKFTYKYKYDIDENDINEINLIKFKSDMADALRKSPNVNRIYKGLKYKYIYYSKDNIFLYEIMLDKNDL